MASLRENREEFLDVLQQIAKNYIDANGAMCTSFILTSEWMNSEGQYYILTVTDDESPPWRHEGLLHYAIANEIYEQEEEEGDE